MQIKLLVSAAAIALAVGLGSASAADQFTTLDGIAAQTMTQQELAKVVGTNHPNTNDAFAKDSPFDAFQTANPNAATGVENYVTNSPNCALHGSTGA